MFNLDPQGNSNLRSLASLQPPIRGNDNHKTRLARSAAMTHEQMMSLASLQTTSNSAGHLRRAHAFWDLSS